MSDMRALATAIEAYHVDNSDFPSAACDAGIFTDAGVRLSATSFTRLTPTCIAMVPLKDGWSRFMVYNVNNGFSKYNIRSHGRDDTAGAINCGTTTDFNDDILFTNGTFVQWPEGAQQ